MKLSRLAGAIALVAAVSIAIPTVAQAEPHEFGAGVTLELPRAAALPTVTVALAAPLAQVDAPAVSLPDDIAPLASATAHLIGPDGKPRWTVLLPFLVYGLVLVVRKWVAPVLPEKLRDALQSRIGGLILTALMGLSLAFLDFAIGGGAFTASAVLTLLIQWAIGSGGAILTHEVPKNALQHVRGSAAGETAMVTLARAARGPNP